MTNDLPPRETDDARDIDHGEWSRPSPKHMAPGPLPASDKKVLIRLAAVAATLIVGFFALSR